MKKMTFNQRNEYIDDAIRQFKTLHDKYTGSSAILKDDEWETYINGMDAVAGMYKGTNLEDIIGRLCMTFLDDTELVQKKLKETEKG